MNSKIYLDEKVCDAMERARIDAELARGSERTVELSLLSNVLMRIRSRLNIFARIEHLLHHLVVDYIMGFILHFCHVSGYKNNQ